MIYSLSKKGEHNIALRLSEFEGMDTLKNMRGKVAWVWVDCFSKVPIDYEAFQKLKKWGYKLCFVSPELQNQQEKMSEYRTYIKENDIEFDAICSKIHTIPKWEII